MIIIGNIITFIIVIKLKLINIIIRINNNDKFNNSNGNNDKFNQIICLYNIIYNICKRYNYILFIAFSMNFKEVSLEKTV